MAVSLSLCAIILLIFGYDRLNGYIKYPEFTDFRVIFILFVSVLCWGFIQTIQGLPSVLLHPAWDELSTYLEYKVNGTIGVNKFESRSELLWYIIYAIVFISAFVVGRSRTAIKRTTYGFLILQFIFGLFSIYLLTVHKDSIFQLYNNGYPGVLSSSFINRNSYAGFVGIGVCLSAATLIATYQNIVLESNGSGNIINFVLRSPHRITLFIFSLLTIFLILILLGTQSRAGISTAILGIFFIFIVAFKDKIFKPKILISFGLSIFVILAFLSNTDIVRRLQPHKLVNDFEIRLALFELNIRTFLDRPFLGTGLGTYADVVPKFMGERDVHELVLTSAHNTYIELLIEFGLLGALPLFALSFLIVRYSIGGGRMKHNAIPLALSGITLQLAIHSIVDFTLEIPANVIAVLLLFGLSSGMRYYSER